MLTGVDGWNLCCLGAVSSLCAVLGPRRENVPDNKCVASCHDNCDPRFNKRCCCIVHANWAGVTRPVVQESVGRGFSSDGLEQLRFARHVQWWPRRVCLYGGRLCPSYSQIRLAV